MTTAVALLISSAVVAAIAAPGLADELPQTASTVTAAAANLAPEAVDDEATAMSGASVVIPVMDNDTDPDATPSSSLSLVGVVAPPAAGAADVAGDSIEYTSDGAFVGVDTFTYAISDGELTDEATVTVTVSNEPNDPPVVVDDQARTRWDTPVVVDVAANDTDPNGDDVTLVVVRRPDEGRAQLVNGRLRYSPVGKYVGPATVRYTVQDEHGADATGELVVQVQPRFTSDITRVSKAVAGRRLTVRGVVSTRIDGPVTVELQRLKDSGRWQTLADRVVRGDDRFDLRWRPDQPGREVLRVRARWDQGHADESPRERVRVEARFDPVVSRVRAKDLPHTWRPGCPVAPSGLRAIRMSFWDYRGRLQRGTLIGASWVTQDYLAVFRRAFETKFRIKKMYPADRYGGVDERAMRAGNTSAFNCRHVTGNP